MDSECTRIVIDPSFWGWAVITPSLALLAFGAGAVNGWMSRGYFKPNTR